MACIPINEKRCPWRDPSRARIMGGSRLSLRRLGRAMTRRIIERALRAAENSMGQRANV
jgi:hypothetical protein